MQVFTCTPRKRKRKTKMNESRMEQVNVGIRQCIVKEGHACRTVSLWISNAFEHSQKVKEI